MEIAALGHPISPKAGVELRRSSARPRPCALDGSIVSADVAAAPPVAFVTVVAAIVGIRAIREPASAKVIVSDAAIGTEAARAKSTAARAKSAAAGVEASAASMETAPAHAAPVAATTAAAAASISGHGGKPERYGADAGK